MFTYRNKVQPVPPAMPREIKIGPPSNRKRIIKWVLLVIFLIIVGVGVWVGYSANRAIKNITSNSGSGSSLFSLFENSNTSLKGQSDGRTNILLLGYGGPGHDGPNLSDTMQVLSINWKTNQVAMLSVPRDLEVDIPGYGYAKINAANSDGGGQLASQVVSQILDIPIQYYTSLNFTGFVDIVNIVGGVDVNVPDTFTDNQYPAGECITSGPGCAYITVHFDAGQQHMNGSTALEFVRSRHGNNGEDSDFARSRRQQLVMEAIKQKVMQLNVLANPVKITSLLNTLGKNLQTTLSVNESYALWTEVKGIDTSTMITKVLDNSANGVLMSQTNTLGDVLVPKKGLGVYTDLQTIAANIFNSSPTTPSSSVMTVEILNGSHTAGIATTYSKELQSEGYQITTVGNSAKYYTQSIVYDCGNGQYAATAQEIANDIKATSQSKASCSTSGVDIQVILGDDYAK